jgi:predicted RNA binding protein YcfA (HicA-like mRNA interferase family)
MRIPRDVSADQLVKALKKFGYFVSHLKGSHNRRSPHKLGFVGSAAFGSAVFF